MAKILKCATLQSKAVGDVIRETGISHSTAYRKIKWMLEEGLLFTDKIEISEEGKKFSLFKSTLRLIDVKYSLEGTTVDVEYNLDLLERTAERFYSLRSSE